MRPFGSQSTLEKRRVRALKLLEDGWAPVDVARQLGVDRRSVRRWRAAYERGGREALAAKPVPGRPRKLDDRDLQRLEKLLLRGARAAGFDSDLWTRPRIADLIWHEFGVDYHADHIGRLLRRLGWSPQKPSRRARERDAARIQGWIRSRWPQVRTTPHA